MKCSAGVSSIVKYGIPSFCVAVSTDCTYGPMIADTFAVPISMYADSAVTSQTKLTYRVLFKFTFKMCGYCATITYCQKLALRLIRNLLVSGAQL